MRPLDLFKRRVDMARKRMGLVADMAVRAHSLSSVRSVCPVRTSLTCFGFIYISVSFGYGLECLDF